MGKGEKRMAKQKKKIIGNVVGIPATSVCGKEVLLIPTLPRINLPHQYITPGVENISIIDTRERPGMSTAAAASYAMDLMNSSRKLLTDANGNVYTPGRCFECRAGEHEDIDDEIEMCKIINPDTGKMFKRGYLCSAHQDIFISDGYILK